MAKTAKQLEKITQQVKDTDGAFYAERWYSDIKTWERPGAPYDTFDAALKAAQEEAEADHCKMRVVAQVGEKNIRIQGVRPSKTVKTVNLYYPESWSSDRCQAADARKRERERGV